MKVHDMPSWMELGVPPEPEIDDDDGHFGERRFKRIALRRGLNVGHYYAGDMPTYYAPETQALWELWKSATLWAQERIDDGYTIWSD